MMQVRLLIKPISLYFKITILQNRVEKKKTSLKQQIAATQFIIITSTMHLQIVCSLARLRNKKSRTGQLLSCLGDVLSLPYSYGHIQNIPWKITQESQSWPFTSAKTPELFWGLIIITPDSFISMVQPQFNYHSMKQNNIYI